MDASLHRSLPSALVAAALYLAILIVWSWPLAARMIGNVREIIARGRVYDRRIGRLVGGRSRLAITRDGAEDQAGVIGGHARVIEAEPLHHAGTIVLDHDVGTADQPPRRRHGLRTLQIEDDAPLAGIELAVGRACAVPERRTAAHEVALGRLDLDDIRAEIRE